jgi:hypothetical protein
MDALLTLLATAGARSSWGSRARRRHAQLPERSFHDALYVRHLLGLRRPEFEAWLAAVGITARPAARDQAPERVLAALPALGGVIDRPSYGMAERPWASWASLRTRPRVSPSAARRAPTPATLDFQAAGAGMPFTRSSTSSYGARRTARGWRVIPHHQRGGGTKPICECPISGCLSPGSRRVYPSHGRRTW